MKAACINSYMKNTQGKCAKGHLLKPTGQISDHRAPLSTCQSKSSSLTPTETEHPEWTFLRHQLGRRWASPSVEQRFQEVCHLLAPIFFQNTWADSILPENFPISSDLRRQLQQHIQEWLIHHRWELPQCIQKSVELLQPQNKSPVTCQAKDKPGLTTSSVSMGECRKNPQDMRLQLGKKPGMKLCHFLGKVPEDPSRVLESSPVKALGVSSEKSQRHLARSLKSDSGNNILGSRDKNLLENIPNVHLGAKSGQINEEMTPVRVGPSWTTDTHLSKSWETCVSTSQELTFLNPFTQQALDSHIVRHWVKHRWSLPLKVLKFINILQKVQPVSLPQFACPSSAAGESGANSVFEVAKVLGKLPQTYPEEKVIINEPIFTSADFGSLSSPADREIEGTPIRITSTDDLRPSEAPPTGQESRQPSWTLNCQSRTVLEAERSNLEVPLLPRISFARDSGEICLKTEVVSEEEHTEDEESVKRLQVRALHDILISCCLDMLNAAEFVDSQIHKNMPVGGKQDFQVASETMAVRGSSLEQQKPRVQKHEDSRNSKSEMHVHAYQSECYRRPNPEKPKKKSRDFETSTLTYITWKEELLQSESPQLLLKSTQVSPVTCFQATTNHFRQWICPNRKIQKQGDPLQKSPSSESQRPDTDTPCTDTSSTMAEAEGQLAPAGQLKEKKMKPHHDLSASKVNQHREELDSSVSRVSCCHIPSILSEQRSLSYTAYNHKATLKCQSCPTWQSHVRDQQSFQRMQFNNEGQCLRHPHVSLSSKAVSPVSSSQHGPAMPHTAVYHSHCQRHCHFQGSGWSVHPEFCSLVVPCRKHVSMEKLGLCREK
ncbi:spermatogenesis-associated protein 31A3 [Oryctolagus cuniculus]|uniref:SPATA31 domain-containing protein n=1 Tax=Oryctolagus cuniculus TaxID=9986 RepID=G1SGS4_RABIT